MAVRKKKKKTTSRDGGALRGKLRPHDPFELIRWLALSQPDPRKALSELVQNSLDAGAANIRVTRRRERGVPCLKIFDDGEGVIPEMERSEALRFIATHIGHSRKRSLSPQMLVRQLGGKGSLTAIYPCSLVLSCLPDSSRMSILNPGIGTVDESDLTGIDSRPCMLPAIAQPVSVCHQ